MEDNKKNFLHKVIEFLVKDTIIDYGDNHIYFPFFPSYSLYISVANLDYFSQWDRKGRYSQYCKDNYGLTHEESLYVWGIYIGMIKEKINTKSESLNESDDRRKNFLDKVVDFLVKDTKVDYDNRKLFFPFTYTRSLRQNSNNLTSFHKLLFDTYIPMDYFVEYIEEIYGITSTDEIEYVWEKYKVIMNNIVFGKDTSPLYFNESIEGKDKILLDRILKYLIDDTIVDHDNGKVTFPFFLRVLPSMPNHCFNVNSTSSLSFSQYCKYTYGLNDDEVIYLYSKYKELFSNKVYGRNSINESDDRKQKYLDKILEWFVRDTIINYETSIIYYPFSSIGPTGKRLPSYFDNLRNKLSMTFPSDIHIYCRDTYGLNPDETKYIWDKYKKIIRDRYDKETMLYHLGKPINESDDKKQVYLNKVVDWLVRDTEIGNEYWFSPPYYYPGSSAGRTGFRPVYEHTFSNNYWNKNDYNYSGLDTQLIYFKPYCLNNYGLTEDEIDYVWKGYMKKLYESNIWGF